MLTTDETPWDQAFEEACKQAFLAFQIAVFLAEDDDDKQQKAIDDFQRRIESCIAAKALALEMFGDAKAKRALPTTPEEARQANVAAFDYVLTKAPGHNFYTEEFKKEVKANLIYWQDDDGTASARLFAILQRIP